MAIVQFENVTLRKKDEKNNEVTILSDLSFSVEAGTVFALAGPSGSGKSSALRLINRLDDCSSGNIYIDGKEIRAWDVRDLRNKVGFMFQEAALFEGTVMENVLYGLCIRGLRKCEHEPTALELLKQVGLSPELLHRNVESLSGGQKQRVNLARTLALNPDIILMDEPTSSLDPAATRTIENLIQELNAQGRTFIVVSHSLEQIERLASACVVLDAGRKVFAGSTRELFAAREITNLLINGKEDGDD
ncbi:MAG: phosphate ABC transporter ATP-binding protein [Firmicutes bacterium]|nr:phosphate ABC transporter ATP-binding protein [Bacillota bacterium]